jgi:hypothetical protein
MVGKCNTEGQQMGITNKNMFSRCENTCMEKKEKLCCVLFMKQMKIQV